ncbi:hypothetical protein PISMIDRAFT_634830 [Pisolithus microcarpus 441]|uniref:T6SS Phospholipase effector Tle1-like catalytic domain-containing protein n=1 Tax=Pisolithus microcarpus 441 TaxID=765257 RepID=A0A0C9YT53_9AGAM|nr:hypothetical protein PISMIDRAFT_634830 [Pisolithus microcarpus 441]
MTPAPKTLLIFCDGSGEDGNLTNWNGELWLPDVTLYNLPDLLLGWPGRTAPQNATNVLRLFTCISGNDCKQQLVLYMSGVGSEADFEGNLVGSIQLCRDAEMKLLASKIRDAYAFLAQNFNEGDEICLFGVFHRGAYTVRKLAGLIDRIGLLTRENLGNLFTIWSQLVRHQTPTIPPDTRKTRIK